MRFRGLNYLPLVIGAPLVVAMLATPILYFMPGSQASVPAAAGIRAMNSVAARAPQLPDNQHHLYVLDGWGGVHAVGSSPALATTASWPHRDIAFSLALFPDGTGGYVLDGWGGLHAVGDAPAIDSGLSWPHWVGAREVVMAPWSSSAAPAGYLLDADGGIHPFGGAPAVNGNALYRGEDVMRSLVLTPNSTPTSVMGYTLDAYGVIHPFGGAPAISDSPSFPGQDIARGLVLNSSRSAASVEGYTLDGSGGIHPFGGAPSVNVTATWPGQDMADSIVAWTAARPDSPGGWVLGRHGDVHPYGSAPNLAVTASWPQWDIARGLAGAGSGGGSTERLVLDSNASADGWGNYYNQRDARWASQDVGSASFPVWKIGCLLSDLAMVYSHFGFSRVTPSTIASHSGWFNARGEIFNSALQVPGHTTEVGWNPSWSWIADHLAAGHPVIVGMKLDGGGTHFVTLTGLNGPSDYWTNDPWQQNGMHVTFSGDWPDRGQVYEAIAFI